MWNTISVLPQSPVLLGRTFRRMKSLEVYELQEHSALRLALNLKQTLGPWWRLVHQAQKYLRAERGSGSDQPPESPVPFIRSWQQTRTIYCMFMIQWRFGE